MDMSNKCKVKLYVVFMEDSNKLRTPVSVCLSERSAQDERIFLSANFNHITFVVDECYVSDPLPLINEAIVNFKSLL